MVCDKYVIVGKTEDGVEHFINAFYSNESYFKMFMIVLIYKCKKSLRKRYTSIYLKRL